VIVLLLVEINIGKIMKKENVKFVMIKIVLDVQIMEKHVMNV